MVCWPLAFSLEGFLYLRFYCGDSESLDSCIQKTLSSLYPPFELTAATVLCQVLDVVEKTYRGDGLSYLIDFLIPAKRILQGLQQEACLQYCGLLFRHAGWPLCIQDKIVLQLASIDWRLLQPGDFYLQVVPYLRKTPRVVLKCLAHDQHNVEELVLPDVSYSSIFTLEWLEFINSGRMGTSLENCLLTSDEQLFRVPWDSIVHPEFIEKTTTISDTCPAAHEEAPLLRGENLTIHHKEDEANHITMDPSLDIKLENSNSDIEGEYVELADVSVPRLGPQLGSLTQSIALNFKNKHKALNQRTQSGDGSSHNKKMVCPSLAQTHCPLLPAKRAPFMGTHLIHRNMDTKENIVEYNRLFRQTLKEECKEEEPTFQEPADISYGPSNHFHHTLIDKNKLQSKSDHRETGVNTQNCEQTSSTKDHFNTSLSLQECKRHSIDCSKKSLQDPATERSPTPQSVITEQSHHMLSHSHVCRTSIDQTVSLVRSSVADENGLAENFQKNVSSLTDSNDSDHKGENEASKVCCVLEKSGLVAAEGGHYPRNTIAYSVYAQTDERVNGESEGILGEGNLSVETGVYINSGPCISSTEDHYAISDCVPVCPQSDTSGTLSETEAAQQPLETLLVSTDEDQPNNGPTDTGRLAKGNNEPTDTGRLAEANNEPTDTGRLAEANNDPTDTGRLAEANNGATDTGRNAEANNGTTDTGRNAEANNGLTDTGRHAEANNRTTDTGRHAKANNEPTDTGRLAEANNGTTDTGRHAEANNGLTDTGRHAEANNGLTDTGRHAEANNGLTDTGRHAEANNGLTDTGRHAEANNGLTDTGRPVEAKNETTDTGRHAEANSRSTDTGRAAEVISVTEKVDLQQKSTEDTAVCVSLLSWWQSPVSSPVIRNPCQTPLTLGNDVNLEILMSGLLYFPGTRDRSGRAVVIINTRNTGWLNPHCNASELGRLLLYFHKIPRRDCQTLGLTLLVDARRCSPVPALFKAFHLVQAAVPNCIHGILLLVEKELTLSAEKPHGVQFDLLTSTKSLHKHIDASQLPPEFDGSFPYCHRDWLAFRMKLEHLQEACRDACIFLQNAIRNLHVGALPDKATEANQMLQRFGHLMRTVLEDTRLVKLQTEGGAILARLRKEESCVTLTDDYRDAVESATDLYNKVDEGVHSLVKLSNKRIQDMEMVIEFEAFEERFQEISGWIETVGMRLLGECSDTQDSLEVVLQAQRHFREFESVACEYCRRGREILQPMERWENVLLSLEVKKYLLKLQKCKEKVGEFSARLEESRQRLERTVRLYQFFDKAYEWALDGMRHLASISLDDCNSPDLCGVALESLERYQVQHAEIDEKVFVEMRELACELNSESGAKQWKFAWSKCQEARHVFEKKMEAALRTKKLAAAEQHCSGSMCPRRLSESMGEKMHSNTDSNLSHFQNQPLASPLGPRERRLGRVLGNRPEFGNITEQAPYKSSPLSGVSSLVSSAFRTRKMSLQSIPGDELRLDFQHQDSSISSIAAATSRPLTRRLLRKAQSFDLPGSEGGSHGCQRRLSEPGRRGNTGVFIKGLEVSSTELAERACSPRQPPPLDWSADRMVSERRSSISSPDGRSRSSKLRHIIDEMVTTEREYVRSLWYISENYFPEMERLDLPQDLRGKRGIIFGNLEKLRDFHSQYFLKELESCCNHPLRVSHCFLRHKDQFGMYALYSKNKPRSDQLLASHGNIFFKNKQRQLGDKMDLASYLLKPIQRMSKYALLLKDLIKECGEAQEQELAYLRAAEEMVKFQLRHGNDLLAMDAIRDCDVNLKEQGQLVRQDEFTVWLGRKKCQRHVFLFEDLILFSKPKRIEGGLDVYIYKRSFKTADIGLTENSGDSGLRFEIWFRRRKSNDTHVLQASSPETKHAWTCNIAKILWQQANRNKEIRMQEMVSMGVGNKPFLDITPSDAAINNRAIDYIMKGRGARTRASIAVSLFDHSDPYKRTQAPITCTSAPSACGPSSASLLGPLNLHMYVNQTLLPGVLSPNRAFETSSCLEEDELENETSCSQPSMTTESSGSSQCMSAAGSSGSDSGCVSGIPQDNLSEDATSPCDASAPYSLHGARHHSSLLSPAMQKAKFRNQQYISAV
ncbi:uncharacterized protein LOC134579012 isoform X2 [Pelobates fuscus]|uniref:uncharacterized protein LOC134579012 isoform X2 n=1 Tax=Pelobates fuscus TaxID=191477 RepID=UPI002FE4D264